LFFECSPTTVFTVLQKFIPFSCCYFKALEGF
jgi:hypothetical protein